jgi:hypothetical protein
MPKNKKNHIIIGVMVFAIVLVGAIFTFSDSVIEGGIVSSEDAAGYISAGYDAKRDISPETIATPIPIIIPEPAEPPANPVTQQPRQSDNTNPEQSDDPNEIILTVIEDRPEPPEPPVSEDYVDESVPHTPPQVQTPEPPPAQTPNAGDTRDGEIYFPGFGWVANEGGGSQGQQSYGYGSLDNIIGR